MHVDPLLDRIYSILLYRISGMNKCQNYFLLHHKYHGFILFLAVLLIAAHGESKGKNKVIESNIFDSVAAELTVEYNIQDICLDPTRDDRVYVMVDHGVMEVWISSDHGTYSMTASLKWGSSLSGKYIDIYNFPNEMHKKMSQPTIQVIPGILPRDL